MESKLPTQLHLLARRTEGQWVVACLDFSLAAQDDTFEAARERLIAQIGSYVREAYTWEGGAYASKLLSRKAPWHEWMWFRLAHVLHGLHAASSWLRGFEQPFNPQYAQV